MKRDSRQWRRRNNAPLSHSTRGVWWYQCSPLAYQLRKCLNNKHSVLVKSKTSAHISFRAESVRGLKLMTVPIPPWAFVENQSLFSANLIIFIINLKNPLKINAWKILRHQLIESPQKIGFFSFKIDLCGNFASWPFELWVFLWPM